MILKFRLNTSTGRILCIIMRRCEDNIKTTMSIIREAVGRTQMS
jgi:hypothetical protein